MKAVWCISYILLYSFHGNGFLFDFLNNGKIETIGYGFIGGTLNMTCIITKSTIQENASDIIFTLNDTKLNNTFILAEKSKELVLQLSGPQMNTAHIFCQVFNPNFTLISSKIINVEYAPQNITNISCVNHEWDAFMYCSWSHPVEYLNQSNIQVTSRWKSQFIAYVNCSNNYNDCNLTEGRFFSNKIITISVEVKNTRLNVSTTGTFEFDANKIVKPPPLEEISYEIFNSTCILLKWTNVRPQRKKNVNVTYESEWKDSKENVRYLVVENDDYVNRTLCGLLPFTKYNLNFTVYPEFDGYPSEIISISTEKTRSSVPLHSPNTTGGAMYYKTQDCQQGNLRNVTIYWQVLEEKNWFGDSHSVSIQYNETGDLKTTTVSGNISSYTMQLDCNHAYYINITAVNDAGPSLQPSFLRVPKYELDFQPPMVKVEVPKEGNTSLIDVSWNVASTFDQSKVEATVFWCKKSVGSICEGQVNWNKCSRDSSTCSISADSPYQYTFGVSIETYPENTDYRTSTGLQWEECIYVKDKKPEIQLKLSKLPSSEDRAISLQWERPTCQLGSPFIIKYTVYYCKIQERKCKGVTNQKVMKPEETFLKLNNLEAEQEYGFWITASSEWGEGPSSDWVYGTPVDNNLNPGEIVGIVIGGLFVLVLAVAGAVFIIRHVKKNKWKIPPIEMPETHQVHSNLVLDDKDEKDDNEKDDTVYSLPNGLSEKLDYKCMRQLSKDSGFADDKNRNSEEEEKELNNKDKEKGPETKTVSLPQDYMRVEGHGGSNPIHEPEIIVGFMVSQIQSLQVAPHQDVEESTYVESEMKPHISSYIKISEPNNQHSVKASGNIEDVKTQKQLEVPAVNGSVQGNGNRKSSPEKYGIGQPEAAGYMPVVPHPQTIQADSISQSHPDANNYISNVTGPESEQAAGNNMDQSNSSNITPQTRSEGQSVVSDYVTSVPQPQPQQMCTDRSTNVQQAVSGYVSNVMNSFPLSGNNIHDGLTNDTCSQPMSTSKNTQCQSSVSGYVTSIPSPCLPPANNESQVQPAVNDHVFNTQSLSAESDNHNQPAQSKYALDALNADPAELCGEYQATQDNYLRDTTIMKHVSMDVNPHDQMSISNYVTSVTNRQPGSE
ncbi:hypothetical protein ACJMK2_041549 [Sinanodonta woodiana]|uniref:Fibronectin type-III domain-containing protein n=1 Tax=Sinanodonta woodiana TaxID=1069815 RepID=A0ABD3W6D9_SINWO